MKTKSSHIHKAVRAAVIMFMLTALVASGVIPAAAVRPPVDTIPLQQPPSFPTKLPVFRLLPPDVNEDTAGELAERLGNIVPDDVFKIPTHTGTNRFVVIEEFIVIEEDEKIVKILEQYEARGGFFAYNPTLAFDEFPASRLYDASDICFYLLRKELFPPDVDPVGTNCENPSYINTKITLSELDAADGIPAPDEKSTDTIIGEIWQVPLAIDVGGSAAPFYVPVGGPGGHLSLLITNTNPDEAKLRPPLDWNLYGLQALAIPTHGLEREVVDVFDVVPPGEATAALQNRLQIAMPTALFELGDPELIYYMDDPAVDQEYSIPVWYYPDATAEVDGETVNLRGYTVPAVEGFLPEVTITSPDYGSIYLPGIEIQLTAIVISGEPPYDYSLELEDGTPVASGTSEDGKITITSLLLPVGERPDEGVFLNLEVIDDIGASGMDSLFLQSPHRLFAPVLINQVVGVSQAFEFYETVSEAQPVAVDAIRSMGVQWIRYYNGHGSNLPGTQPDGTGFYNKMTGLGWQGKFHYFNNNAWEKDWRDCSLGGIDCTYGVDRVDFAYFAGHGSPARIYFGVNKDSYNFYAPNARFQNLRWAGFATCQTLQAGPYVEPGKPPLTHWFNSFQGSYMLMGFHSNMKDVAFGPRLVDNMKPVMFGSILLYQHTIRDAWVLTAFQMNAGKPAYLYAVGSFNPVNRKLPAASSPDPAPLLRSTITQFRWVWWD
jgi:hypothetical protein